MIVALIGGSGFIGSALAAMLLEKGYRIRIFDIVPSAANLKLWEYLDVRDRNACIKALDGSDLIINLAAVHRDDVRLRSLYYDTNVGGAHALCEAMTALGLTRLVFTSSVAVYGTTDGKGDEATPLLPVNDYGASKAQAEQVYRSWADEGERSLVIVRPTVVFGAGNKGNVATLISQIASDRFVMVGKGDNVKSMAAVENLCGFIVAALPRSPGVEVYNYCDKPDFTTAALVRLVRETLGKRGKLLRLPFWLGMAGGTCFDIMGRLRGRQFTISSERIRKFCTTTAFSSSRSAPDGFRPVVAIEEAMRRFVDQEHGSPLERSEAE